MNSKRWSMRLILIGGSCFAIGGVAESIRIGRVISDFKMTLERTAEMADIKGPLVNVFEDLGHTLSAWQILMLVGVFLLTVGLLIFLVRMARMRDQIGNSWL